MRKNKDIMSSKRFWIIFLAAIVVITIIVSICSNLGGNSVPNQHDNGQFEVIQSQYVDWYVPSECMEFLKYENEVHNNMVADMFSMKVGTAEIPIFRFDFGDENAGDWLGLLTIGEEKIPVVYTVFMVSDEELAAISGAEEAYYLLMDVFNGMVKDLNANKNFSADKPVNMSGNKQEVVLTYWTVTLPTEMSCYETNENGIYQVAFYGDIQGERIPLYQVNIGDTSAEGQLGLYRVNGEEKIISMICSGIPSRADWNDDDYAAVYLMMDTINDVIQQIMSSESFSEINE